MKNLKMTLLFLCISLKCYSQALSTERVAKIKSATVKIILNNQVIGTGFYIDNKGSLLTCWHVVFPTIVSQPDGKALFMPLFIEDSKGKRDSVGISNLMEKIYKEAVAYDFCILVPKKQLSPLVNTPFLNIGKFNDVKEGEEVYTCGYPLGIPQPFISKGIISTKYIEKNNSITDRSGQKTPMPRTQALIDMTLNKGNSGGAIVKLGRTIEEDVVIGIADFIINPIGGQGEHLMQLFNSRSGGVRLDGIDTNAMFSLLTSYINSSSNGISGCVSIDHYFDAVNQNKLR